MQVRFFSWIASLLLLAAGTASADELLDSARQGDKESQLKLGDAFFFGRGRRKADPGLALYWFRRAAAQGVPQAQYNCGMCLLNGWGTPRRPGAAYIQLERASKQKYAPAMVEFSRLVRTGVPAEESRTGSFPARMPDPAGALALLREAASGYPPAALELSEVLKKNYPATAEIAAERYALLSRAAGAGNVSPAIRIGFARLLLERGENLRAQAELEKAIRRGSPEAEALLARQLLLGRDSAGHKTRALQLMNNSAGSGNPAGLVLLGESKLYGVLMPHDPEGAAVCFRRAAEAKDPAGMMHYGKALLSGIGTPPDRKRGEEFLRKAAAADEPEACYTLGCILRDGKFGAPDLGEAFFWFRRGAAQLHVPCMREMGISLLRGRGTPVETRKGLAILRMAAERGDTEAADLLARFR